MLSSPISPAPQAAKRAAPKVPPSEPGPRAEDLQPRALEAATLLKALANADRLLLLCQLVGGERSVSELGVLSCIGQPSLSQQLGVLRGERLVATRREGKQIFYRIASPAAMTVLAALHTVFCDPVLGNTTAKACRTPAPATSRANKKVS